jgi:zinc transport system substrate-binding protein
VAVLGAFVAGSLCFAATSCSGVSRSDSAAPVLHVVTALYPLAEAVSQIGQSKVDVVDVVPDGGDPITYRPTAADRSLLASAGLVIEMGGGFQPAFEQAAAAASGHLLTLGAAHPGEPYPWLDPAGMGSYISRIEAAMAGADPQAAGLFKQGAEAFGAEVESTGIDYQSTLSVCPHTTMFTADRSFSTMASAYGLDDVAIGTSAPSTSALPAIAERVASSGVTDVFAETWAGDAGVQAVAGAAGKGVRTLDTLLGAPAGGWPAHIGYIQLLEANLGALDSALSCGGSMEGS